MIKAFINKIYLISLFLTGISTQSYAETPLITNDAQLIAVCSLLDYEEQKEEVAGADYVPGVDVYGRPVRSADVSDVDQTHNYRFYFSLDLAEKYLNLPDGVDLKSDQIPLDISSDGHISLGGKDRTQELEALCKDRYGQ